MSDPNRLIERMLEEGDERVPMAAARAIKRFEGWKLSDGQALKRIRQCIRGDANRGVKLTWLPIIVRVCTYYGSPELITGMIDEVRRDTEYEMRSEARQMRTVRPSDQQGRRIA